MPQEYDVLTFQVDHIIARKHHGADELGNLALACFACNNHKGPNIAGIDPETSEIVRLFHPRQDNGKITSSGMKLYSEDVHQLVEQQSMFLPSIYPIVYDCGRC